MPENTLSAENFWHFSTAHYDRFGVKDACLELQDQYTADVNLLLLGVWLRQNRIALSLNTLEALLATSLDWQQQTLEPLREERRKSKSDPKLYKQALGEELAAEQKEQHALIDCLPLNKGNALTQYDLLSWYAAQIKAPKHLIDRALAK